MSLPFLLINLSSMLLGFCMVIGSLVIGFKTGWLHSLPAIGGSLLSLSRWIPHLMIGQLNISSEVYTTHRFLIQVMGYFSVAGFILFVAGMVWLLARGKLQSPFIPAPSPERS